MEKQSFLVEDPSWWSLCEEGVLYTVLEKEVTKDKKGKFRKETTSSIHRRVALGHISTVFTIKSRKHKLRNNR